MNTSAATFLKWKEVYIFCFLQSETFEIGNLLSECFLSPSLVSVLCSSRGAELTMKGFALRCNPICQEEFIIEETCAVIKKICSSPCFFFFLCLFVSSICLTSVLSSRSFISSCLAAAPSKTQRPFSNVVPLSPLSLSLLPNLAGSFAALSCVFWSLISWYCSVYACMCECVCPEKNPYEIKLPWFFLF